MNKMKQGAAPAVTIPKTSAPSPWSYVSMRQTVDAMHVKMGTKFALLPRKFTGAAVCEEAFALLNGAIFGRKLDEEATTSAFITALIGATRFWAPWAPRGETAIAWVQQFSKNDEARIGADFALVLCRDNGYVIAILQAKRVDHGGAKTATVKRAPSSKELDPDANTKLLAMLTGGDKTSDLTGVHWQLSKLLALRNRIGKNTAEIGYVFWPDDGGAPLYRSLDGAEEELAGPGYEDVVPGQQFVLKGAPVFKDWLIGRCDASRTGGITFKKAQKALNSLQSCCSTAVILDVGANGLGMKLKDALGWLSKAPLAQTDVHTPQNVPKN
ncbi:hypothetical protein ACSUZJ_16005 [Telluria sp. B2]